MIRYKYTKPLLSRGDNKMKLDTSSKSRIDREKEKIENIKQHLERTSIGYDANTAIAIAIYLKRSKDIHLVEDENET